MPPLLLCGVPQIPNGLAHHWRATVARQKEEAARTPKP